MPHVLLTMPPRNSTKLYRPGTYVCDNIYLFDMAFLNEINPDSKKRSVSATATALYRLRSTVAITGDHSQ